MKLVIAALAATLAAPAVAQDVPSTAGGREALEILTEAIAIPTVSGRGNVPRLAADLAERYRAAGFAAEDVAFIPVGETGYFTARYRGRDRAAKPVVVIAHMDVVEAKREDWSRDPFVPVVENGWVYGRGSGDNKAGVATVSAAMFALKRAGFVPDRDIVVAFSGDEETGMKSTQAMAAALANAEVVLNADGLTGELAEDGKPSVFRLQAAEKTYADYRLSITDPGGHSSQPGSTNALIRMSEALARIGRYRFAPEQSPVTKSYLEALARQSPAELAAAMRAFAANPADSVAADRLSENRNLVGVVRTTCIPTMIEGGHAPNAIPQSVVANVNCRIFPGTTMEAVRARLVEIAGDAGIAIETLDTGTVAAPESPLREDVMRAVRKAVDEQAPGLAIIPYMTPGGTDAMHFRARGIPAYGIGGMWARPGDGNAHGLDEKLPVATLDPAVRHWQTLLRELVG